MPDFLDRLNQARTERAVARRRAQDAERQLRGEQEARRVFEEQQAHSEQVRRIARYQAILEAVNVQQMMSDFKTCMGREGRPELVRVQGEYTKRTSSDVYDDVGSVEHDYLMLGYAITCHRSKSGVVIYFAGVTEQHRYDGKLIVARGSGGALDHWASSSLINDALADCAYSGHDSGTKLPDAADGMQVTPSRKFMEDKFDRAWCQVDRRVSCCWGWTTI